MGEIYKRIESLCTEQKINITTMCREAHIPRSALTDYKAGRIKTLSTDKLQKIADYFNVSVDYLLGNTDIKKAPSAKDEGQISDEDLKIALFHGASDVTDEMWEEAKEYARFIYERERRKREKE
ncbi:MAG: helix-turn-helix domain-containing protein [Oscillospiraceae bacterium]